MDARTEFGQLVQQVTSFVCDRDLDAALAADLNDAFGYGSEMHDSLARLIHAGESEGWLLAREAGGIKFGRPVKPCLLYTSPSPRDLSSSRMPSSA